MLIPPQFSYMEIESLCIHNIADFPPSAWASRRMRIREGRWGTLEKNQLCKTRQLGEDQPFGTISDIQIYVGRYIRTFIVM